MQQKWCDFCIILPSFVIQPSKVVWGKFSTIRTFRHTSWWFLAIKSNIVLKMDLNGPMGEWLDDIIWYTTNINQVYGDLTRQNGYVRYAHMRYNTNTIHPFMGIYHAMKTSVVACNSRRRFGDFKIRTYGFQREILGYNWFFANRNPKFFSDHLGFHMGYGSSMGDSTPRSSKGPKGSWRKPCWNWWWHGVQSWEIPRYPLVNVCITMENHHF